MLASRSTTRAAAAAARAVPVALDRRRIVAKKPVRAAGDAAPPAAPAPAATAAAPITLTDAALAHLKKLRAEAGGGELLLRVGVKQGGCSGMSYVMDFEAPDKVGADDTVIAAGAGADAEGLKLVTDPKSLLYLFGMTLDFSSALIGGGFSFKNPNATETCGCGTSFNV